MHLLVNILFQAGHNRWVFTGAMHLIIDTMYMDKPSQREVIGPGLYRYVSVSIDTPYDTL